MERSRLLEAVDQMASEAWSSREDQALLERVSEIKTLLNEQLADDTYVMRGRSEGTSTVRVGREWAVSLQGSQRDGEVIQNLWNLWKPYSQAQQAVRLALEPFINRLDGDELIVVREVMAGKTVREIERELPWSRPTINRRTHTALERLREGLVKRYCEEKP